MRIIRLGAFLLAGLLTARGAQAQFVAMSRCHAAFPCNIPFSLQYRPDPLLAGQYGSGPILTPLVVTMPLTLPLAPRLEKPYTGGLGAALEDAIHRSLETRRPAKHVDDSGALPPPQPTPVPDQSSPDQAPPR